MANILKTVKFLSSSGLLPVKEDPRNRCYFNVSEGLLYVRVGGVEPPRAYAHCHLKTARLPFRHTRRQIIRLLLSADERKRQLRCVLPDSRFCAGKDWLRVELKTP